MMSTVPLARPWTQAPRRANSPTVGKDASDEQGPEKPAEPMGPRRGAGDRAHPVGDQGGEFPPRGAVHLYLGLEVAGLYRLPADHLFPARAREDLRTGGGKNQPPCRLRDDRGGGGRRDRRNPVRRLDRRPDAGADGLCAKEAQGLRAKRSDRGRRADGQAHAAGGGFDDRRPVQEYDSSRHCATPARSAITPSSCSTTASFPAPSRRWRPWALPCTISALGGTCWMPAASTRISPSRHWPRCAGSWRTPLPGPVPMAASPAPRRRRRGAARQRGEPSVRARRRRLG